MHKIVEYGGGLHAEVRFYFRYTWQLCLASRSLGHLGITLSLVKKFLGSWKNSGTFYRYSSCFVWSVSDGPQFGWTDRAFYGKPSSAMILFVNLFVRLFPHIRSARWWIHIEDIFMIDAELVLVMCMDSDKTLMRSFFIQRRVQGSVRR